MIENMNIKYLKKSKEQIIEELRNRMRHSEKVIEQCLKDMCFWGQIINELEEEVKK